MAKKFFTSDLETAGTLDVAGNSELGGTLDVAGNSELGGTLDVAGNSELGGTLDVAGNSELGGTLDVAGATTLSGTLAVTSGAQLSSTLGVAGATTLTSTLDVTGATTLNDNVTINSSFLELDENQYIKTNRLVYPGTNNIWLEHSSSNGNVAVTVDSHDSDDANTSLFKVIERNTNGTSTALTVQENGVVEASASVEAPVLIGSTSVSTPIISANSVRNQSNDDLSIEAESNLFMYCDINGQATSNNSVGRFVLRAGSNSDKIYPIYAEHELNSSVVRLGHPTGWTGPANQLAAANDACSVRTYNTTMDGDTNFISSAIYMPNLPTSTLSNGISEDIITIHPTQDFLYRNTDGAYFSQGHIYHSTLELALGSAVSLANGNINLTQAANEANCVGIVAASQEIDETNTTKDSLGTVHTSGYLYKLASLGDSRYKQCNGFKVCNEGGALQPGDLLVTSSTPGYLMRQSDDIMRSKTVGKCMQAVTFDENGLAVDVYGYIYCG